MLRRTILHVDFNNFYASIEELYHPELRGKPMIVAGDPDKRAGVVLSKNYPAKALGIRTAETIVEAKAKCPTVEIVVADMDKYYPFADGLWEMCTSYTDLVQSGGDDEAYMDVSQSITLFGDGRKIADEIRQKTQRQFGLSCSVGVSYTPSLAKFCSDYKKPNATTVVWQDDLRSIVWPRPASEFFGVGNAVAIRLFPYNILTIGDIAQSERAFLNTLLGKHGSDLWLAANGLDKTPVAHINDELPLKSVGNSMTAPADIKTPREARIQYMSIAENVAARLRRRGLKCRTIHMGVRGAVDLRWLNRRTTLKRPTQDASDIVAATMMLLDKNYSWEQPIRSLGIQCCNLVDARHNIQLSFFDEPEEAKLVRRNEAIDAINRRFGAGTIIRASTLESSYTSFREDRRRA